MRGLGIRNWRDLRISGESRLISRLLKGVNAPVVLDVGAYTGAYSVVVIDAEPSARVYAFEPHPDTFARLRAVAAERGFMAIDAACGARNTRANLFDLADEPGGSEHASRRARTIQAIGKVSGDDIEVDVVTLDTILSQRRINSVSLLRVDAEGGELDVLRGALAALADAVIEVVQFEFNGTHAATRTFLTDFRDLLRGYTLYRLLPRGLLPLEPYDPFWCEVFAFQNVVAIGRGAAGARRRLDSGVSMCQAYASRRKAAAVSDVNVVARMRDWNDTATVRGHMHESVVDSLGHRVADIALPLTGRKSQ